MPRCTCSKLTSFVSTCREKDYSAETTKASVSFLPFLYLWSLDIIRTVITRKSNPTKRD